MDQKDILNALHMCAVSGCDNCPYDMGITTTQCLNSVLRDAANEISRLQAELLELKEDIEDELSMRKCKF